MSENELKAVVEALVDTVELKGGVFKTPYDDYAPVADPDWLDLADVYLEACHALNRSPLYGKDPS